jgi:hypothetical protein
MKIIKLNPTLYNMIGNKDQRWFISYVKNGIWALPTQCPHRGGPLHLGKQCKETGKITCPWHQKQISFHYIKRKALPLIKIRDTIHIIAPLQDTRYWYEKTMAYKVIK